MWGDTTLVYLHIPKTGGSSIRLGIESCLDAHNGEVIHGHANPPSQRAWQGKSREDLKRVRFAWAHWPFSYYTEKTGTPNKIVYMTCLRDPIKRVISFYQEFKYREKPFANPNHRAHFIYTFFNKYSLEDALDHDLLINLPEPQGQQIFRLLGNTQTRVIANTDNVLTGDPGDKPMREYFLYPHASKIAIENLEKHFSWIGISDFINKEFNIMSERLSLSCRRLNSDVQYHNVSPIKETNISTKAIQKIEDWNRLDRELFNWCMKYRSSINTRPIRRINSNNE